MQRIQWRIPRNQAYPPDGFVELYGDLGSGEIDEAHPLPPGRVALWPADSVRGGHLDAGHLRGTHLGAIGDDGHLEGDHLADGHLAPRVAVALCSPRYVFGRFQHVLRTLDDAGNASASEVFVHTVNSAPRVPGNLRIRTWDAANRRTILQFAPVTFKPHRGS